MRTHATILTLASLSAVLGGCAAGGLDYDKTTWPAVQAPTGLSTIKVLAKGIE